MEGINMLPWPLNSPSLYFHLIRTVRNIAKFTCRRFRWRTFLIIYLEMTKIVSAIDKWKRSGNKDPMVKKLTFVMPLEWSWTQPTILVRVAGPQVGHCDQVADRHLGGHGTFPHRRLLLGGDDPAQCTGATSRSPLTLVSTQRYLPT